MGPGPRRPQDLPAPPYLLTYVILLPLFPQLLISPGSWGVPGPCLCPDSTSPLPRAPRTATAIVIRQPSASHGVCWGLSPPSHPCGHIVLHSIALHLLLQPPGRSSRSCLCIPPARGRSLSILGGCEAAARTLFPATPEAVGASLLGPRAQIRKKTEGVHVKAHPPETQASCNSSEAF